MLRTSERESREQRGRTRTTKRKSPRHRSAEGSLYLGSVSVQSAARFGGCQVACVVSLLARALRRRCTVIGARSLRMSLLPLKR